MVRSVSIRRSLLVNLVAVITILGVAIIVTVGVSGRLAVRRLSGSVIMRTTEQVAERLHNFFDPVAAELSGDLGHPGSGDVAHGGAVV